MSRNDWRFSNGEYVCGIRSAAVIIRGTKLLVQREACGNEYALPGGHIKIGESTESGLIREFAEETGARIVCRKLLWTEESRFSCCGKMYHYITFYYLADPVGGSDIPDTGSPFPQMDNSDVLLEWIPVSRLGNITIHPSFLKDEIGCTDGTLRHFVSIE